MRTRIIAILALLATTLGTHADDVVTVVTQNGQKSYSMDKLARIEVSEDDLVVPTRKVRRTPSTRCRKF